MCFKIKKCGKVRMKPIFLAETSQLAHINPYFGG